VPQVREPESLCEAHSGPRRLPAASCQICRRRTNAQWLMCGWCASERGVCSMCGIPVPAAYSED
jgi:hypothetical protein